MLATFGPLGMNPDMVPSFYWGHFFCRRLSIGDLTAFLIPIHHYVVAEKRIEN